MNKTNDREHCPIPSLAICLSDSAEGDCVATERALKKKNLKRN